VRRPPRSLLLYVVLAALLLRVLYLQQVSALPFFQEPVGDSAGALARAREILAGQFLPDTPFFYGGILYPWALAGFALLFGSNLYPVCLAQALLGCLLVWSIHRLCVAAAGRGRRRRGRRAGLAAAAMAALYGPFAFLEADILMVSWTLPALVLAAILLLRARRRVEREAGGVLLRAALAGALLALAATERPNLIALLPAAAGWWVVGRARPFRPGGAAALLAAAACVVAPITWMNHAVSQRWVLLTTSGGINFAIGNHPGARGTFSEPWPAGEGHADALETDLRAASLDHARRASGRDLDAVDASRYWWSEGMRWIKSEPGAAARLCLRKAALFWSGQELPNHLHFDFLREAAPALWLMPITFGWIAPLGLYGLLSRSARQRLLDAPAASLLALMVLVPMITVLPFFVADRYRVTAVPPLIAAAGFGLMDLRSLVSWGARRRAAARAAGLLLGALVLSYPIVENDRSRDHWMLAQAWKKQGRYDEAARSYRKAVAMSPDDAVLRNNLGLCLALGGDPAAAEREYRRALALDPSLAFPAKNLGLLLMRQGRLDEARAWLRRAHDRAPLDAETERALAGLDRSLGPS